MNNICIYFTFFVSSLIFILPASSQEIVLKTGGQDLYPKYYKTEGGETLGICADIAHAVEMKADIKFVGIDTQYPLKRLLQKVEDGDLDLMFCLKKNEQRAKRFLFIEPALYPVKINSIDDLRNLYGKPTILTMLGTGAHRFLEKQGGLILDDGGKSVLQNLEKLKAGRGRFYFHHDLGIISNIQKGNHGRHLTVLPHSFNRTHHYTIFSKKVPLDVVQKIKNALDELEKEGELEKIYKKYVSISMNP
ncbi:substrate-binding periplasmic protein [Thermodesulfobacteriota bacterium]